MRKDMVAEWLLRRVVDTGRASELVGDQMERHPNTADIRFWISIAGLFLAFSKRSIVAVVLSPVVGLLLAIAAFVLGQFQRPADPIFSGDICFHARLYLMGMSVVLWAEAAFLLMKYGWSSILSRLSLTASILLAASTSFFSFLVPAIVLAILWLGFCAFCITDALRRHALAIVIGAAGVSWSIAWLLAICSNNPHSVFGNWQFYAAVILIPVTQSTTTTFLYSRLITSKGSQG